MNLKRIKHDRRSKRFLAAIGLGAVAAYLFDPDRGRSRRAKLVDVSFGRVRRARRRTERTARWAGAEAYGLKQKLMHMKEDKKIYNDPTLAQKVESQLFQNPGIPKGDILINSEGGVISLRGEVNDPDLIRKIERMVGSIHGVRGVHNLLHLRGTPAPH